MQSCEVLIPKIALSKSLALNDITIIELNDLAQGESVPHTNSQYLI
ncbi:hypothetical protein [Pseudoalteromonas tunicata]|jgi:hypothetical protein|uniref:Uncharacterized protein n=1 Tax=Pseudoalteromonas tunicata D2 TaxID=87626 RepID=A4C9Z8_9GAMM|nr:hypothetical protein [Pseudoalteromonas tunicata]ATC94756.1 hypothetical protein PTUN_a2244 [Pseudoalteromonas tunicata]EAR28206.1 hypothetical protein PTD2_20362 [Pseudoalteromonas tunicata D2]